MARLPRFVIPGQPQHVIVRGNNREPIFLSDSDYRFYLEKLRLACTKHRCDVHAYVLMTNHLHLLITPHQENGISKTMQMLGRYYVQYFNFNYRRTGTLWEGRYKATLIDSENYALICHRYIELNPVRANMVVHPEEYPWSSYRHNALGEVSSFVTPHSLYQALGATAKQRQAGYRALFQTEIPTQTLDKIRAATNKAWVLGSDYFKERVSSQLNRPTRPNTRGGDRKSKDFHEQQETNRV